MQYATVSKGRRPVSTNGSTRQARDWVARQLRFERLLEELRTPAPPAAQNGACAQRSD